MKLQKYTVGQKLKPKAGRENNCVNWTIPDRSHYKHAYIVYTNDIAPDGTNRYKIFDASGQECGGCYGCFTENDLEPYEPQLSPSDLKPGDWVEVVEELRSNIDKVWPVGSICEVKDVCHGLRNLYLSYPGTGGLWTDHKQDHAGKLRKCDPPEEKPVAIVGVDYGSPAGDRTSICYYCSQCQMFMVKTQDHECPAKPRSTSSSPSLMDCCTSIVKKARDLALSPMERKYRKLGLKDADGLTSEGRSVFLDLLFEKFGKELMDPRVKQLSKDGNEEE